MIRKGLFVAIAALFSAFPVAGQEAPEQPKAPPAEIYRALIAPDGFGGSFIGVQIADISKENMSKYGLNEVRGVAVEKVVADSPAAKAGLAVNDVIVSFNGETVSSAKKLTRLVSEVAPDHMAKIKVLRNGAELNFDVVVAKREAPQPFNGSLNLKDLTDLPKIFSAPGLPKDDFPNLKNVPRVSPGDPNGFVWTSGSNRQIGISVSDLSEQLGDFFGVAKGKGILVNSVRENSPASRAGIKAGDVIVEIDGKETNSSLDLIRSINEKQDGEVNLTLIRDKQRRSIALTPEKSEGFKMDGDLNKIYKIEPPAKLKTAPELPAIAPFNFEFRSMPKIVK